MEGLEIELFNVLKNKLYESFQSLNYVDPKSEAETFLMISENY